MLTFSAQRRSCLDHLDHLRSPHLPLSFSFTLEILSTLHTLVILVYLEIYKYPGQTLIVCPSYLLINLGHFTNTQATPNTFSNLRHFVTIVGSFHTFICHNQIFNLKNNFLALLLSINAFFSLAYLSSNNVRNPHYL